MLTATVQNKEYSVHRTAPASLENKRDILIVDDSRVMRQMVISAISCFDDFNFIQAKDGIDALEKINTYNIKLIILDYNMPRMNGIEFMRQIRKNKEFKRIPIIMLTTETDERKMVDGYVSGARVYMTKPFKSDELIKIVKTIRYWHMK